MNILQIANIIKEKGGELYLVGGAVRDEILKRKINDEDYCVTGLTRDEFLRLFPDAIAKGKQFEVYEIDGKEFALARTEIKKIKNSKNVHKSFIISTYKNITIEEDLARRDITINSIAKNVLTNKIIDPFNGLKDIENKVIRATTQAFVEDPLRVYRVARFASELGFKVETQTMQMMQSIKQDLYKLPGERVFNELKKVLVSPNPTIFFEVLKQTNLLDVHFKEISDLIGALQPKYCHPEGDAFNHTMQVIQYASKELQEKEKTNSNLSKINYEIMFSALVHDLGKGVTPKEEYPHHYLHDVNGVQLVENLGKRLKIPSTWLKSGKITCKEHMRAGKFYEMKTGKKVDFIEKINKTIIGLEGLQIIVNADKLSRVSKENYEDKKNKINFCDIGKKCIQEINGKYIIEKYGLEYGDNLKQEIRKERINWLKKIEQGKQNLNNKK